MNHLAHLILADGSPDSIVGNFLGDFAKGRPEGRFPAGIVRGIRLHRRLDRYTDDHPAMRRAVARFPAPRRRFAGIAVDMALDHLLSRDWLATDPAGFARFRRHVHAVLRAHGQHMPTRARHVATALTRDDWLLAYADWNGMAGALHAMSRRLSRPNRLPETVDDLAALWADIETDLHIFWSAVREHAVQERRSLAWHPPETAR